MHARIAGFLEVFLPEIERRMPTTHSRILLVGHAAIVITLTRELLGDLNLPLRVGCCTLTELKPKPERKVLGGWTGKKLATGEHLRDGIQRDWGFEDIVVEGGKVYIYTIDRYFGILLTSSKVVDDPGVPGTGDEEEGPVGCRIQHCSYL